MKKQEFNKMRRGLGTSGTTLSLPHLNQRGARRRKGRARNWKLIWKNNGELPQSGKGNRLPESPGSPESPKEIGPRKYTPTHIIITLPKIKDKERILKAIREKDTVTYKGVPIILLADFSKETLQARRGSKEVFEVMKGKDLHLSLIHISEPTRP